MDHLLSVYSNLLFFFVKGTKCISGEHLSVSGGAVNDCHAEVVARRCLCEYLYNQLDLHIENKGAESILEPAKKGFKLKQGIQFHLYINTAPCGDARIFSPHEENDIVDKHPNRRARGQLRTKIESGEGTIPVKSNEGIQTWDGVLMVCILCVKRQTHMTKHCIFYKKKKRLFLLMFYIEI